MGVVVTGIGVVSALGANPEAFRDALRTSINACATHNFERFDGTQVSAPAYMAVDADPAGLIPPRKLRRMFRLARMSAVAARQSLKDAELDPSTLDPTRLGVCFGTGFGAMEPTQKFMDSWIENGEANASPLQFMNSVHGIMASQIAMDINAQGVNLTTAQRDICFEAALDTAVSLLEAGRADVILVGGGDELTPMLHEFGSRTQQLRLDEVAGLDPAGAHPGIVPGDGACVVVLERDDSPRAALARVSATRIGRCDNGPNIACELASATSIDLVTTNRDGAHSAKLHAKQELKLRKAGCTAPVITHRGNFGTYPSAGAQQFAANVMMLHHAEIYTPMANGQATEIDCCPPQTILHNAASISGNLAAYVLTKAD